MSRITNSTVIANRIGKLMRLARKSSGMTQMKVAGAIGINQPVLSKVENLSLELGVVAWLRACELFKIDPQTPLFEDQYDVVIKKLDTALDERLFAKENARRSA